jgi:hypothetical protein
MADKTAEGNKYIELVNSGVSPDTARKLAEQWAFSDVQKAYERIGDTAASQGKGITTPGKYGVYVANPLGAFASGFGSSYAAGSGLANAIKTRKELGDVMANENKPSGAAEHNPYARPPMSSAGGQPKMDLFSTDFTPQKAQQNALRGQGPMQPPMQSAQTYPATPPSNPMANAQPIMPNQAMISTMNAKGMEQKPEWMSDADWMAYLNQM